jgi:hypothetical protein
LTLQARIEALATRIANYIRDSVLPRLIPTGGTAGQVLAKISATNFAVGWVSPAGGADPWARTILAADYTNPLATFANITDGVTPFTYTPPANSNFTLEAELIVTTTTIANLPRIGVLVAAGVNNGYAFITSEQDGATATTEVVAAGGYNNNAAAVNVQYPAGGVPVANQPVSCTIRIKGRSGSAPQPISLQMAAETAGANICFVKRGSEMRTRSGY